MQTVGLDPEFFINRAGLDRSVFDDPDNQIDYQTLAQLTEDAANASGCEHLALLVGSYGNLGTLGPAGTQAVQTENIGDALGRIIEAFREHDTGAILDIDHDDKTVGLRYLVIDPQVSSAAQIALGAVTVAYRVLEQLSGGRLIAKSVKLPMRKPRNSTVIADFFKCPIHFNSPIAGLFFDGAWLAASLPELKQTARDGDNTRQQSLRGLTQDLHRSAEIISSALLRRVFAGLPAGAEPLSKDFNVDRRTLHRRLSQAGTSYQELRDEILAGLAQRLLSDTEIPIFRIAELLGYSELPTFTRAFRSWKSVSPSEYRRSRHPVVPKTVRDQRL